MRRSNALLALCLLHALSFTAISQAHGQSCATENGDINADGLIDIADGISLLSHLFATAPIPPLCSEGTLPGTGQVTCFDGAGDPTPCDDLACPGQDGSYLSGCPTEGRFVDNLDGTVSDTCTGLMWQRMTGNGGVPLLWCDALEYCEDLEFAGHSDWRMPNIRELESLVNYENRNPAIDPTFNAILSITTRYQSSTSSAGIVGSCWKIGFNTGGVFNDPKDSPGFIRACRTEISPSAPCASLNGDVNGDGGVDVADAITLLGSLFASTPIAPLCPQAPLPATGQFTCYSQIGNITDCSTGECFGQDGFYVTGCPPSGRFVDNLDGTVMDTCTGLMWQQATANDAEPLNWCDSLAYCESLTFAGYSDWRLPNARELHSLSNYQVFSRALDPIFEAQLSPSMPYWTSSSAVEPSGGSGSAWIVGATTAYVGIGSKANLAFIRAVRTP